MTVNAKGFSLQLLHDLEIAGSISWYFDGAWHVTIGSPVLDEANVGSEEEAMAWFRDKAKEHYGVELSKERRDGL